MNYIELSLPESIEKFKSAIRTAGLTPPHIINPGELHHFPGKGKAHSNKAGWCILFEDLKGGSFGDFSSDLDIDWQIHGGEKYSPEEREIFRQRYTAERELRTKEQQQQYVAGAVKAREILSFATGEVNRHPYAVLKKVPLGQHIKRGAWSQRGWKDALLVPFYNKNGEICTLQAINMGGEKDFLKDGLTKGCFYPFGKIRDTGKVFIGEGVATVAAVYAVTNTPAVAAMHAGNLYDVALAVRELAPEAEIVLLADNDISEGSENVGLEAAIKAAQAVSGTVAIPEMDGQKCDFWDLLDREGEQAVNAALDKAFKPKSAPSNITIVSESTPIEPEPLRATLAPEEPFPVNKLGTLLEGAVMALYEITKAPLAMCVQSVLAVASYAAQSHFDVMLPWSGRQKPLTLFFLTVGESGERKSSVDDIVLKLIKEKEQHDWDNYNIEFKEYQIRDAAYQKAVEAARRKVMRTQNRYLVDAIVAAEKDCGKQPTPPIKPMRLVSEPTIEGLYKLFEVGQPNVALFSDEAGLVIGGHALNKDNLLKTIARWGKLWDGGSFDRVRAGDGAGSLYGRRMAIHLLAQPKVMNKLLSDETVNDQGLLARCLIAYPDSTIGQRINTQYKRANDRIEIRQFLNTIQRLIDAPPQTTENPQELAPIALILVADAIDITLSSGNAFERLMAPGADLCELRDKGSKALENACRLAGIFAVIENGLESKEISAEHIERAICILQWYLKEALRIRSVAALPQSISDAEMLMRWLKEKGIKEFGTRQILTLGPNPLRNKQRLLIAIEELIKSGYLVKNNLNKLIDGVRLRCSWEVQHYVV